MNQTFLTIILTIIFAPILLAFFYGTERGKKDLKDLKDASEDLKRLNRELNISDRNKNSLDKKKPSIKKKSSIFVKEDLKKEELND